MGQAEEWACLGNWSTATTCVEEVQAIFAEQPGLIADQIRFAGIASRVYLHNRDLHQAQQVIETAIQLLRDSDPIAVHTHEGYVGIAESCMQLWLHNLQNAKQVRQACQSLQKFAQSFPITQPRALLWQGRVALASGQNHPSSEVLASSPAAGDRP